jgi:hypothetical protein
MDLRWLSAGMKCAYCDRKKLSSLAIAVAALTLSLVTGCSEASSDEASAVDEAELMGADAQAFLKAKNELEDVKRALHEVDDDDARLARVLGKIGPAFETAERAQYVAAFYKMPGVAKDYATLNRQATKAAMAIEKVMANKALREKILKGSYDGVVATKDDIYDVYKTLARTTASASACAFGSAILDGAPELAALKGKQSKVEEEIVVPACTRTFAKAVANGKDIDISLKELASTGGSVKSAIAAVQKARASNAIAESAPKGTPQRLFAALQAAATLASIGKDASQGHYADAIRKMALGSPQLITGTRDAVSVYRVVVHGGEALKDVSGFTGRLSGGLLVLTSAMAIREDLEDLDDTSDKVKLAGDCIAAAGGMFLLAGASTVGAPIVALSSAVLLTSRFLKARELDQAEKRDRSAILPTIGLHPRVLAVLLSPNNAAISRLSSAGLSAAQLQKLMREHSVLLEGASSIDFRFVGYDSVAKSLGWSGDAAMGLIEQWLAFSPTGERDVKHAQVYFEQAGFSGNIVAAARLGKARMLEDNEVIAPAKPLGPTPRCVTVLRDYVAAH